MKKIKRLVTVLLAGILCVSTCAALTACGGGGESETKKIIAEAQTMTLDELCVKAIEESNGKTFDAIGNSSRGKTALNSFIAYLQTKDSTYKLENGWTQPKNNTIFEALSTDAKKSTGTYAMTLIQDGNQIESKMVQTGILDKYYPKAWAAANNIDVSTYDEYLSLQTLNKVFMYNNTGNKTYTNIWDFVAEGEHGLFMDVDSEVVGKNFLYMLTEDTYATKMKEAYDAVTDTALKTRINTAVSAVESKATEFQLGANGKYALAWIKLWVESYNAQSDDGPICTELVKSSATDKFGLLVYSKLRSVTESTDVSKNNVTVAAYQDNYVGLGGYGYCHYLFVTDNSPLPWTACAFIAYMTETVDGFDAWGKDIGGYTSNPTLATQMDEKYPTHATGAVTENDATVTYSVLADKGYTWWKDRLAIEDPVYCAKVSFTVGGWIDGLTKYGTH